MKKILFLILVTVFSFTFLFSFSAAQQKTEKAEKKVKETITKGEIVDIFTYIKTGKHGEENKDLMTEGAKNGNLLGLLSGSKVYLIISNDANSKTNDQLLPYLARKVVVVGKVVSKGGTNVIMMSNVDTDKNAK